MSLLETPTDATSHPFADGDRIAVQERAQAVADIAARDAVAVDRDAVFPAAAITAAKANRLLSMMIPTEYGGDGASLTDVADVCYTLGQSCASTAMIVAMHQAAIACVIRHHRNSDWHADLLRRCAAENLLLASSTTEGQGGGNVRSSDAALIADGDILRFERAATVMSYGAQADGIVSTARRDVAAAASDQVLITLLKEDYRLTPKGTWDTLGMRGTCSGGFALSASLKPHQILPVGYDKIHPQTMVPVSHVAWAAVWAGIAASAVARAQTFVRTALRRSKGAMPPGSAHVTRASASLRTLIAMIAAQAAAFEGAQHDEQALASLDRQASLNLFKVEASEHAVTAVTSASKACGLAGYRNDGEFTVGRQLRDVLSAPLMIHNERILTNITTATLMSGVPASLRG